MSPASLEAALRLRAVGQHDEARAMLVVLTRSFPDDALLQFETACVHDYWGLESEAVPFYLAALAGQLPTTARRSAYTGLGSTYRALGLFKQARETLENGIREFPSANEMHVFLAMVHHNLGESKRAVEGLLHVLVGTTSDLELRAYARAIEFYAEDVDRTWPGSAA